MSDMSILTPCRLKPDYQVQQSHPTLQLPFAVVAGRCLQREVELSWKLENMVVQRRFVTNAKYVRTVCADVLVGSSAFVINL